MPPYLQHVPEDEGFEALLRPIQDLTRNWDVDLSLHLEEYINYIRQICGENIPDMNFAQAAVLIQNSANIYSKKVDFLFTTVLQLLDTISKKQSESKNKDNPEEEGGGTGQPNKRRKNVAVLETEEFVTFDEVCADRVISIDVAKEKQKTIERKKLNIVLNAGIKVKAKDKTSCNVFNHSQDVMGKKEEFRLNWRICSTGTLHEEFVIKKNKFQILEPVEEPVFENDNAPFDESHGNNDLDYSHDNGHFEQDAPLNNDLPHIPTSPLSHSSCEKNCEQEQTQRESVLNPDPQQKLKRNENLTDAIHAAWEPLDFNQNIPEKPVIKKKKILKNENKRKLLLSDLEYSTFTVADFTMFHFKNRGYLRDKDFGQLSMWVLKARYKLLADINSDYQDFLNSIGDCEQDFQGFDNDHDSDGDGANDDNLLEVDVPLPERENIVEPCANDGWQGDDINSYENEVRKTIQAYKSREFDDRKKSDLAKRVEEWHQRITPKLEAAEQRSSFDINQYGTKVLNSFDEGIGSVKSFQDIVSGQPREEVARYFLASLMLTNQYNVEISESEPGDLNVDCVQLKLLSLVRHHEELDDNMRQTSSEH